MLLWWSNDFYYEYLKGRSCYNSSSSLYISKFNIWMISYTETSFQLLEVDIYDSMN